jgi:hypothetical protein
VSDLSKFIDDEFGGDLVPLSTLYDPSARDPSTIGLYPATLPIEVALHETPLQELKAEYGFTDEEWSALPHNPQFISDLKAAKDMLKKEGMSFRAKARLQADELLKRSWILIHSSTEQVPPSVQADLIKATMRWAGYDNKEAVAGGQTNGFNIQINLR